MSSFIPSSWFKKSIAVTSILGIMLTGGCAKQHSETTDTTNNKEKVSHQDVTTLNIGYQKAALNLLIAKQQDFFKQEFPNATIQWREFPAGPQMLEALAVGAVDFGYVGNTPPIFAQAANKDIEYIGYEVAPATSQAILVPSNSTIKSIEDLKGKRIAVQKGSSAHELLAKVLQKANLTWQDIQPVWLPPADARAALDKNAIDAWSIWEPYLSAAELDGKAKVIISGDSFPVTYSYYLANPKFIQTHPQAPQKFLDAINKADQWYGSHQEKGLQLYAQSTGLSENIAQAVLDKRLKPSPIHTITPEVIKSQQQIADLFTKEKLIPVQIDVSQIIWLPEKAQN